MNAWHVVFVFFAALGLFCFLWGMMSLFLPRSRGNWLLCPGREGDLGIVFLFLWLRGMGILTCPLKVLDQGLSDAQKKWLVWKEIEVCSANALDLGENIP